MALKSSVMLVPVDVPLGLLDDLTKDAIERLEILAEGFQPDRITLLRDAWNPDNVLFSFVNEKGEHIINGLIEPDGCAHT